MWSRVGSMSKSVYHVFPGNQEHLVLGMLQFLAANVHAPGERVTYVILFSNEKNKKLYGAFAGDLIFVDTKAELLNLIYSVRRSQLLLLHSTLYGVLFSLLFLRPQIWSRCIWITWGGDFYFDAFLCPKSIRQRLRMYRVSLICRYLGAIATLTPGDYQLISQAVKCRNKYVRILYPIDSPKKDHALSLVRRIDFTQHPVRVLLGNSASESNRHLEALHYLEHFAGHELEIICPLSYPRIDSEYRERVISEGKKLFGDRFIALCELMPPKDYHELLSTIDILVFNHWRQQGLGNLYHFLFSGKKIFLSSSCTTFHMLKEYGVSVYETESIPSIPYGNFSLMPWTDRVANIETAQEQFSDYAALSLWRDLLRRFC